MRRALTLAAAAAILSVAASPAAGQQNLQQIFGALGDPAAFLSANQQRFKFELDAIEHRFQSVFGGVCAAEAKIEPPPDDAPPQPPPEPPQPPDPPDPEKAPEGQVNVATRIPRRPPEPPPPKIAQPESPAAVAGAEDQGRIVAITLIDANTERAVSVEGFDPLNEQQLRQEFLETPLAGGGNDDGDGGGGFAQDVLTVNAGPPPSQASVYLNPATGDLSPVELPGTFPIDVGFDDAVTAFAFAFGQVQIVDPNVGGGSASIRVGQTLIITIDISGVGRFRLAITPNANFTITVRSIP